MVAVVIPTYNRQESLLRCLTRLFESNLDQAAYLAVVALDGCTDESAQLLSRHFPQVEQVHGDGSWWWSGAINAGARRGLEKGATHLLLLNDDVEILPDTLAELLKVAQAHPEAIVGSKIVARDQPERIWCFGGQVDWWGKGVTMTGGGQLDGPAFSQLAPSQWLPGMGTLIPARLFRQLGGMDTLAFPQYFGDTDFTLRAGRAGIPILVCPQAVLHNDIALTGLLWSRGPVNLARLHSILFSQRSHANFKTRFRFWRRHCPWPLWGWQCLRFYGPLGASVLVNWLRFGLAR